MMTRMTIVAGLLALTGCGSGEQEGVGGVSASDARALNEAAAKLDAQAQNAATADDAINPAAERARSSDR